MNTLVFVIVYCSSFMSSVVYGSCQARPLAIYLPFVNGFDLSMFLWCRYAPTIFDFIGSFHTITSSGSLIPSSGSISVP